tara:strand:+ start:2845 stop:3195 length:351 start_codon:yes stop_codon:yes gene_type:complete
MANKRKEPSIRPFSEKEKTASIERSILNGNADNPNPRMDVVNKPPHYNASSIECIDAMKAMSEGSVGKQKHTVSNHQAYCWQNSFKYLWRWPYKNGVEDLKKCRWYLDRLIEELEE